MTNHEYHNARREYERARYAYNKARWERVREKLPIRLAGVAMLIITAIIVLMALKGNSIEECDITPVVVTIPASLYCLLTKSY